MKSPMTLALLIIAGAMVAPVAAVDCAMVPEAYRAKCEEALKAKGACAGKTGDEYKKCVTGNVDFNKFNSCAKETDAKKKSACEVRTKAQEACKGKMGDELKACVSREAKNLKGGY